MRSGGARSVTRSVEWSAGAGTAHSTAISGTTHESMTKHPKTGADAGEMGREFADWLALEQYPEATTHERTRINAGVTVVGYGNRLYELLPGILGIMMFSVMIRVAAWVFPPPVDDRFMTTMRGFSPTDD